MSYFNNFDRQYGHPLGNYYENSESSKVDNMLDQPIESTGITIKEMGASANPFEHQTKALMARIKEGASRVEFSFMGQGKGNKQSFTPETFGNVERQEMRDLARINEVETSTHASPNVGPLSGLGQQGFNDEQRKTVITEIKKAIDFAAEATTGGAIVFHTGEWQRSIEEERFGGNFRKFNTTDVYKKREEDGIQKWDKIDPREADKLSQKDWNSGMYRHGSEQDSMPYMLADADTGKVQAISRDMKFFMPEIDAKATEELNKGKPKQDHIDIYKIEESGPDKGQVKVKEYTFDDVYDEIRRRMMSEGREDEIRGKSKGEIVLRAYLDKEISQAKGDALRWSYGVPEERKFYENLVNIESVFKEKLDEVSKNPQYQGLDQSNKINAARAEMDRELRQFIKSDGTVDNEELDGMKERLLSQIRSGQSTGSALMQRAAEYQKQLKNMRPIEEVGLKRTSDTIAEAAVHAMEMNKKHRKNLNHDLYVAPESYDTNLYGGHPDEIRNIIDKSREAFVQKLINNNRYSKKEAEELAKKHIKGTLDIGHLNMWKQYFVKKDNETREQHDKRFNNWILDETEKLAKDGYIGHAHVSDNFGYDDEHLVPGEGNAPVAEFIRRMKGAGINEFIQEPGSFNYEYALRQTWRNMGIDIGGEYRPMGRERAVPGRVDKFLNSYFGHTAKPSYVFGKYMPNTSNNDKSWTPWSGTPL
ncbi:MAG: TIM barrel protein [Candidatus Woesearchaeota archaeon]